MTESSDVDDLVIINRIIEGNVNDFDALLNKYEAYILAIVKKHVPRDQIGETAQDAFVRIYKALPGFKPTGSFKSWIASIAVRVCYDRLRENYRNQEITMSSLTEKQQYWLESVNAAQSNSAFEAVAHEAEAREVLDWALNHLDPKDRLVVELVHLEELSCKEASKLTGWSVANIKIRAFRARKTIRKLLETNDR